MSADTPADRPAKLATALRQKIERYAEVREKAMRVAILKDADECVDGIVESFTRLVSELAGMREELAIEREGNPHRVYCPKCQANLPCESCARYSVNRDELEAECERLRGTVQQLAAVDAALPPWESPPGSETGCVGRVQTILNLVADRESLRGTVTTLRQALAHIQSMAGHPDAAQGCRNIIAEARAVLAASTEKPA